MQARSLADLTWISPARARALPASDLIGSQFVALAACPHLNIVYDGNFCSCTPTLTYT
jgi:hypothetical protein